MTDSLLDIRQAAKYLNISQVTLRWHVNQGRLAAQYRDKSIQGSPNLYKQSDLDNLKLWPNWKGRKMSIPKDKPKTNLQRIRSTKNGERPIEDEKHITGCIIHWSERFRFDNRTFVPITCANCGTKFDKPDAGIFVPAFTGCCSQCYASKRKSSPMKSNGTILRSDDYIFRHIRTFTEEEQKILRQMPLNNDIYIAEHRAVMALHLNRPLMVTELVHHINGDKKDNQVTNLHLYEMKDHSKLHSDQFGKVLNMEWRIENLEDENLRLRQLLIANNIMA